MEFELTGTIVWIEILQSGQGWVTIEGDLRVTDPRFDTGAPAQKVRRSLSVPQRIAQYMKKDEVWRVSADNGSQTITKAKYLGTATPSI